MVMFIFFNKKAQETYILNEKWSNSKYYVNTPDGQSQTTCIFRYEVKSKTSFYNIVFYHFPGTVRPVLWCVRRCVLNHRPFKLSNSCRPVVQSPYEQAVNNKPTILIANKIDLVRKRKVTKEGKVITSHVYASERKTYLIPLSKCIWKWDW